MASARKMNLTLLFMAIVVLAATAAVLLATHPSETRETRFWTTFAFLGSAVVVTFAYATFQNVLRLDAGALPLPLFMGLGTIVLLYDAFVIATPLLLWKALNLSATIYVLAHGVGLAFFLVLGGAGVMASLSSTPRAAAGRREAVDFARRADDALSLARKAAARQDAASSRAWEEAAEALRYADPLGVDTSRPIEDALDEALAEALALTHESEGPSEHDLRLALGVLEGLRRRKALLLREK